MLVQQGVEFRKGAAVIRHTDMDLLLRLCGTANWVPMENDLREQHQRCGSESHPVQSGADGHSDGRCRPHTGGRCQADNTCVAMLENNASPQKGNAADHLCRNTCRVCAPDTHGPVHIQIHERVLGQNHKHRRRERHNAVGADTRFLRAAGALHSHNDAQHRRHHYAEQELQVVVTGQNSLRLELTESRYHKIISPRYLLL